MFTHSLVSASKLKEQQPFPWELQLQVVSARSWRQGTSVSRPQKDGRLSFFMQRQSRGSGLDCETRPIPISGNAKQSSWAKAQAVAVANLTIDQARENCQKPLISDFWKGGSWEICPLPLSLTPLSPEALLSREALKSRAFITTQRGRATKVKI